MGSIVLYIIEWAFALIVLLTIYKAAFSGTTLYRFNRFYLLGATLLSALLPLVQITFPEKAPVVSEMAIENMDFAQELSGTFMLMDEPTGFVMADTPMSTHKSSLWAVILVCTYSAYVLMLLTGWVRSIIRTRKFLRGKNRRHISHTVWLVTHDEEFGPFSWMNYIVISDTESGFARRASLRHEYSHVRLLHSVDLVFLLACTILNPVCWLVLQEIKIVHEYEADNEVINRYGIRNSDYQKLLIMRTVGAEAYALASSFNLNIKKRIIMMNKNKTRKRRLMWLLLLLPLLGMTSVLFARTEKSIGPDDMLNLSLSNDKDVKENIETKSVNQLIGKVSIRVVDENGDPIKSAMVGIAISESSTTIKGLSDSNGKIKFDALRGDIIVVEKQGFQPIKILADDFSSELTVTLHSAAPKTIDSEKPNENYIRSSGYKWIYIYDVKEEGKGEDGMDNNLLSALLSSANSNMNDLDLLKKPQVKAMMEAYKSAQIEAKEKQSRYNEELIKIKQELDALCAEIESQRDTLSESQLAARDQELMDLNAVMRERFQELQKELTEWSNEQSQNLQPLVDAAWKVILQSGAYVCVNLPDIHPDEQIIVTSNNIDSALKDLFEGRRAVIAIRYSDNSYQQIKDLLSQKYANKAVFFTSIR
ncbi:MAG: hypothetical protein IK038_05070 [Bacteroidaceae bacterium]|nr:hypothetical protein [Bacteroidaceae bacterium]